MLLPCCFRWMRNRNDNILPCFNHLFTMSLDCKWCDAMVHLWENTYLFGIKTCDILLSLLRDKDSRTLYLNQQATLNPFNTSWRPTVICLELCFAYQWYQNITFTKMNWRRLHLSPGSTEELKLQKYKMALQFYISLGLLPGLLCWLLSLFSSSTLCCFSRL